MPGHLLIAGRFLIIMRRARTLTNEEWLGFDYRAFVTRGDADVEENFDRHAGTWRQGDPGQPLSPLILGGAEPEAGIVPAEYNSFGVLGGRIVAVDYG